MGFACAKISAVPPHRRRFCRFFKSSKSVGSADLKTQRVFNLSPEMILQAVLPSFLTVWTPRRTGNVCRGVFCLSGYAPDTFARTSSPDRFRALMRLKNTSNSGFRCPFSRFWRYSGEHHVWLAISSRVLPCCVLAFRIYAPSFTKLMCIAVSSL